MNALVAAAAGGLFALGLVLSGMTSPNRVIGFLDVIGDWDPSLAFVMGGALVSYGALYRLIRSRFAQPLLTQEFQVPPPGKPDGRLLVGACLFGIGWGLVGLCPGPALVALGAGKIEALVFVLAMAAGMAVAGVLLRPARDER